MCDRIKTILNYMKHINVYLQELHHHQFIILYVSTYMVYVRLVPMKAQLEPVITS